MTKLFTEQQIKTAISNIAKQINSRYFIEPPVFVITLTGGIFFATDLLKEINCKHTIEFIKCSSYKNNIQTNEMKFELFPDENNIKNKEVIVIEDIIDTGITMQNIINKLNDFGAKRIAVVSLLDKPEARKVEITPNLFGFTVKKDDYVVGYGLDDNNYLRNLKDIYKINL